MRTFLLLCLVLCLWSCQSPKSKMDAAGAFPAVAGPTLDSGEIRKYHNAVENFLNASLLRGNFNGSILVAKNGTIVYEKYVGFRDLRVKDSLDAYTPLQIASTSKPFTSAAILKLVQEGELSLNDTLGTFFPGFPYPGVTVKMLLNHRSGLPNYLYYLDKGGWDKKKMLSNEDVLQTLMTLKPPRSANPDRGFQYCNTNFVLLALIVERVSGESFPAYLKENFFEPLQMENTSVVTLADSLRRPLSFKASGGLWAFDYTDGPYGDKNIASTARDLLKWDQALYYNTIINKALMDSAFQPYSNEKPSMHNYGLGWRLLTMKNGKKVIYHNGHWHGFNSAFARLPDEKATIIILGNKYNSSIYTIARRMYNLFGKYDENGGLDTVE
ncbi:serine hydrolase domain-containing protein [Paraflavisolibacter sp. H34]|uniref:serine hydrolase domain-containing protein n=1 Tax=Huijunlia imazamoxiresistens TaxID=3127457 RepID=UPI00301AAFB3